MKIDLNKTVVFDINGEQVVVKTPRVKDHLALKQLTNGIDPNSSEYLEKTLDWLEDLGLGKKYTLEMDQDSLSLVINEIVSSKKN